MVSFLPSGPRIMFSSIAPPQDFINLILYFSNFNGLTKKKKNTPFLFCNDFDIQV